MKKIILYILILPAFLFGGKLDFLVSSEWLEEHMEDENFVILETRYFPHRYFTVGHIEGALQVQRFKDLGTNDQTPMMRFPSKEVFQKTLRGWGINNGTTIVLYDDSRSAMSSRIYFLLDIYGYDMSKVKFLNGGTVTWGVFNEMVNEKSVAKKQGNVTLKEDKQHSLVEWTAIYQHIVSERDPNYVLLDSRPEKHYSGEIIKHALHGGHIPGAVNVVSLDGTEGGGSQKWKSLKELEGLYSKISKEKTIYVYCHDGFRMTLAYMQLKLLGYKNVKLYNGGWSDWGMNLSLPVVEGKKPYSGDFEL